MIYSVNNKPLVLIESDADNFLESVGVRLYEDEISINGTLYEGVYGESILAENGIFLYEDGIVLEGEAAKKVTIQDYKARKEKEEIDDYKKYKNHQKNATRRRDTGFYVMSDMNPNYKNRYSDSNHNKTLRSDSARNKKVDAIIDKELSRRKQIIVGSDGKYDQRKSYARLSRNKDSAASALHRNMRRHPEQYIESTIFSDIEII